MANASFFHAPNRLHRSSEQSFFSEQIYIAATHSGAKVSVIISYFTRLSHYFLQTTTSILVYYWLAS